VLIVDDVVTTGETTRRLARVLLENGVKKVSVLAVAKAA
jgi:predicted amidophosphoribosyltransferase